MQNRMRKKVSFLNVAANLCSGMFVRARAKKIPINKQQAAVATWDIYLQMHFQFCFASIFCLSFVFRFRLYFMQKSNFLESLVSKRHQTQC